VKLADRIWRQEGDKFILDDELLDKEIRDRAYSKWKTAGCPPGRDQEFWLEAESEINELAFSD
jgi:hypothetical protein